MLLSVFDLCNKAYHAACLHLPKISEGAWVCQECSDLIFEFTSDKTVDQYHGWLLRHSLDILTNQISLSPHERRVRGRFIFPSFSAFRELCNNLHQQAINTQKQGEALPSFDIGILTPYVFEWNDKENPCNS